MDCTENMTELISLVSETINEETKRCFSTRINELPFVPDPSYDFSSTNTTPNTSINTSVHTRRSSFSSVN